MGLEPVHDVPLVRHAYVLPADGAPSAAISAASSTSEYKKHGFALVPPARKTVLLTTYWNIPDQADRAVGRAC